MTSLLTLSLVQVPLLTRLREWHLKMEELQSFGTPLLMLLPITPSGLVGLLEYFQQFYGNPPIYIHENGQRTYRNTTLQDIGRVRHMHGYIGGLLDAVRNGSNARGYFVWSFLDLFELLFGFEEGYGLYYVDLDDKDLKRYPKLSAHWYSNFLKGGNISLDMVETISSLSQSHLSE
ncbi:Cyanidin 3-O-glucoside 7-O-glucosyltransferase(AA7GT) like [Actinidia chinensis var. chinensis]|uniref:Cyanidin 3-O-glucoside 7-O-glucosyltransferase(AA7GT) like n=1 Tax=Actinidia chinensis var. chinensis TaxID=1590841 RepID=A0A2R6PNW7_ACTCC|nr:Cyanidin 3-O-glucoside 7-O-glucosyltransferase(AA7GT) like [Actinidia chinensis var. chinensis]